MRDNKPLMCGEAELGQARPGQHGQYIHIYLLLAVVIVLRRWCHQYSLAGEKVKRSKLFFAFIYYLFIYLFRSIKKKEKTATKINK